MNARDESRRIVSDMVADHMPCRMEVEWVASGIILTMYFADGPVGSIKHACTTFEEALEIIQRANYG